MTCKLNVSVIALVLVLNLIAIVSPAQSGGTVAVYLKGGDVRIGQAVHTDTLGNIRLVNDCGIFNISKVDIDSITPTPEFKADIYQQVNHQQGTESEQVQTNSINAPSTEDKKWYNLTSVALLMGQGLNGFIPVPSITNVTGIRLGQRVMAGIGIGYEYYGWSVMPVFAEAKYTLVDGNVTPFLSMKLGYGFPFGKTSHFDDDYNNREVSDFYGGLQLNPEAGLMIRVDKGSSVVISLGYHFQHLSYKYNQYSWWGPNYNNTIVHTDYNRISFRIGYMF